MEIPKKEFIIYQISTIILMGLLLIGALDIVFKLSGKALNYLIVGSVICI